MIIEACVDSVISALAAQDGGARRIELCDSLNEGGITPSAAKIALCRERLSIQVFVLIRPRAGDFHYGDTETAVMLRDIAMAKGLGADGVVIGALNRDGTIDVERVKQMVAVARPMAVTFHRAFDQTPDALRALEVLRTLGIERVLTSGRAATALEGVVTLKQLVEVGAGRVTILAGGGVNEENAAQIVEESGVTELHIRGTVPVASEMTYRNSVVSFSKPQLPNDTLLVTDANRVRAVIAAVGDR